VTFRRAAALAAVLGLLLAPHAQAAGTVTSVEVTAASVRKITWSWLSTAGGAADGTTTAVFDGELLGLTTIPAGGGSAPTDDYDITVTDADGHDVLLGAGANRDTANTEHVAKASLGGVAGSKLTLNITNAGSAKSGTVILRVR
jgi:hypothetical protein